MTNNTRGLVRTLSPHYKNSECLVAEQKGDGFKALTKYLVQNYSMSETHFSGYSTLRPYTWKTEEEK